MPLYQSLGIGTGTEKVALVFDLGLAYTKVGFAGEPAPRAVIPTRLIKEGGREEAFLEGIFEQANVDKEVLAKNLKSFFYQIYFKYLQINPKDRRVIICESLLNPTVLRETISDVLFTNFEIPSVLFAPHHLLSCFTVAVSSALVLDCSQFESSALPIIEGTPVIWGWHSGPLGSIAIHDKIQTLIRAGGLLQLEDGKPCKLTEDLPMKTIEDIKVKSCFVADYERAKLIQEHRMAQWRLAANGGDGDAPLDGGAKRPTPPPDMVYPLEGNKLLLIPGLVREEAAEILFEQDNDRLSVATLVLDALLRCPLDCRKELAKNLILTGGTSMLPGFAHRLLSELRDLVAEEERYQVLSECKFFVHKPPTSANLVPWLGAAIFASLEAFQQKSVSKEYFIQHGRRLPDWCVLDLKPPEQIPERPTTIKGLSSLSSKSRNSASSLGLTSLKPGGRSSSAAAAALASLRLSQSESKLKDLEKK